MSESLEKRKWFYLQPPKVYEMSPCPKCGNIETQWSEYEKHLWCAKCEIDFIPEREGIFGGAILVHTAALIGISFDIFNLETERVERFNLDTCKHEPQPKRIQRKRVAGWRMPPNTVYVGRPSKWGNPFKVGMWFNQLTPDWFVWTSGDSSHFGDQQVRDLEHLLELFEDYAKHRARRDASWLEQLRGKDLACWCSTSSKCHAGVLLRLMAN